jgi:hypothetical protein
MKSLNELARVGFIAHWKRYQRSSDGDAALRAWLSMSYQDQEPWIEAARAVYEAVKNIH